MLDEPVCGKCSAGASHAALDEGLGLKEMADFIRELGVPDSLAGFSTLTGDTQSWEKVLGGGSIRCPASLNKAVYLRLIKNIDLLLLDRDVSPWITRSRLLVNSTSNGSVLLRAFTPRRATSVKP